MSDAEHREQHNHGSGTFVGGDVHGGLWQVFLPPYGKKTTSSDPAPAQRRPEQDDQDEDDYEGRLASTFVSAWIAASAGLAVVYAHQVLPQLAERIRAEAGWPALAATLDDARRAGHGLAEPHPRRHRAQRMA
ncbi:hypothetical protein ABZ613_10475 [Streptomyces collinus]|uniref:hypothetical protein n=1 Tax=Streptomyces collinus TaxID=42684 RepID=UPI0033D7C841